MKETNPLDIPRLINACLKNDPQAWNTFFKHFGPFIIHNIEANLPGRDRGDPPDRENVVREIYCDIYCNIRATGERNRLPNPRAIYRWLKTTARNAVLSWHNRRHRHINLATTQAERSMRSLDAPLPQENDNRTLHDVLAAPEEPVLVNFEHKLSNPELLNYLAKLPDRDLWVLRLRYIYYWRPDEETCQSLAHFIRCSPAEAKKILDSVLEGALAKQKKSENELAGAARLAAVVRELTGQMSTSTRDPGHQDSVAREIERKNNRKEKLIKAAGRELMPPHAAVAEVLGISENNSRVVCNRLKKKIQRLRMQCENETKKQKQSPVEPGDHGQE